MTRHFVESLAGALVHSLWQGGVIALLLLVVLELMRHRRAPERYMARCAALGLMGLSPLVTFLILLQRSEPSSGIAVSAAGAPVSSAETLPGWIMMVWLAGASLMLLRLAMGALGVCRLKRAPCDPLPSDWQRRFDRLARLLDVRAQVRLVGSDAVVVPTVIGCTRPVILLPASMLTGLSRVQIESILAHELAHIRRHDFLVNLIQSVIQALLFYHPAVWWVSRGIRAERENCCDDIAVRCSGGALEYAGALAALATWRRREVQLGLSTRGGPLMQRIERLLRPGTTGTSSRALAGAGAALAATSLMGAAAFGLADLPEHLEPADESTVMDRVYVQVQPDDRYVISYPGTLDRYYVATYPGTAEGSDQLEETNRTVVSYPGFDEYEYVVDFGEVVDLSVNAADWADVEAFTIVEWSTAAEEVEQSADQPTIDELSDLIIERLATEFILERRAPEPEPEPAVVTIPIEVTGTLTVRARVDATEVCAEVGVLPQIIVPETRSDVDLLLPGVSGSIIVEPDTQVQLGGVQGMAFEVLPSLRGGLYTMEVSPIELIERQTIDATVLQQIEITPRFDGELLQLEIVQPDLLLDLTVPTVKDQGCND